MIDERVAAQCQQTAKEIEKALESKVKIFHFEVIFCIIRCKLELFEIKDMNHFYLNSYFLLKFGISLI